MLDSNLKISGEHPYCSIVTASIFQFSNLLFSVYSKYNIYITNTIVNAKRLLEANPIYRSKSHALQLLT